MPELTGNMVGYVYTFDEFGDILDDHSEVKVTATGVDKEYSTLSDSKGRFELTDLPTGTYELSFEKEGFGVLKQFGVQHLGGKPTILNHFSQDSRDNDAYFIYEMPTTEVTNLTIENDTLYGDFSFTEQEPPQAIQLRLYFSTEEDFNIQSAQYVQNRKLFKNDTRYLRKMDFENYDTPFQQGEKVFFRARIFTQVDMYRLPQYGNSYVDGIDTYYDYESNKTIYPNINDESAQFSFIFSE
ncbi:MAG: carboxypeptidase-like regulatory domain-containing protein [Bacteroidales bacterium]|nr:carboxypeptidase-like regulatory domain-containing protein [Bacteroidales bacterium]